MTQPAAIITDIEGTTTPIAFVHDVLFPYARARLPSFLQQHAARPDVAAELAAVGQMAPAVEPLTTLLGWMDADAKIGPLKALQGMIWAEGYADGSLKGQLYADVAPALRRWHAAGIRLYVYSSGSVAAQRLLFRHSVDGDLESLFSGFFDTKVGGKNETSSYLSIAAEIGLTSSNVLFLSDSLSELSAAHATGMQTRQLARSNQGIMPESNNPAATTFENIVGP